MSAIYEFDHECEHMPDGIVFCKVKGSSSSLFMFDISKGGVGKQQTALWGFRYCPYCGADMEKVDE